MLPKLMARIKFVTAIEEEQLWACPGANVEQHFQKSFELSGEGDMIGLVSLNWSIKVEFLVIIFHSTLKMYDLI